MAGNFYGGQFFGGGFFGALGDSGFRNAYPFYLGLMGSLGDVAPDVDEAGRPRPDDKHSGKKRVDIFKPTGLDYRKATPTVDERIADSANLHADAVAKAEAEVIGDERESQSLSPEEVEYQIGVLLRKKLRTEDEEILLLMLMMA